MEQVVVRGLCCRRQSVGVRRAGRRGPWKFSATPRSTLGGGPRAFQKYETRAVAVSRPMSNLLRLLERHPEALNDLKAAQGKGVSNSL